jgi:hypothetical protein
MNKLSALKEFNTDLQIRNSSKKTIQSYTYQFANFLII